MRFDIFWSRLEAVLSSWTETKMFVEHSIAVSTDALHAITGVLILFISALLLRKPVSSRQPWLVVLAFTALNEFVDLWVAQWPSPGMQFGESAKDFAVTMLLPTVLLFTARKAPQLFLREPPRAEADDSIGSQSS